MRQNKTTKLIEFADTDALKTKNIKKLSDYIYITTLNIQKKQR